MNPYGRFEMVFVRSFAPRSLHETKTSLLEMVVAKNESKTLLRKIQPVQMPLHYDSEPGLLLLSISVS